MKKIAVPLIAGILALGFMPSASAATPRADRYYVVVCNGTEYESVDAHAVELGGKAYAVALFSHGCHVGAVELFEGICVSVRRRGDKRAFVGRSISAFNLCIGGRSQDARAFFGDVRGLHAAFIGMKRFSDKPGNVARGWRSRPSASCAHMVIRGAEGSRGSR